MSAGEQQNWHYASANGERLGPVSIGELSALAGQGTVGPKTLVWSEGYRDWIPAEKIADLLSTARTAVVSNPVHPAAPAADFAPGRDDYVVSAASGP